MVLVFVIVEFAAVLADPATFSVALRFEDVSRLEEDFASVLVSLLEPVPQLLVPVRVVVQCIDRVLDLIHTLVIGEPFEQRPQLPSSLTEAGILDMKMINVSGWSRTSRVLT